MDQELTWPSTERTRLNGQKLPKTFAYHKRQIRLRIVKFEINMYSLKQKDFQGNCAALNPAAFDMN